MVTVRLLLVLVGMEIGLQIGGKTYIHSVLCAISNIHCNCYRLCYVDRICIAMTTEHHSYIMCE